jgi:amino acid permease
MAFMYERDAGVTAPEAHQALSVGPFAAHMIAGIVSAVFALLVHCLIFTYFLGTGRWVKEVARAYHLPDDDMPKLTREFKRQVFPPALFAMLSVIAAVASGAGAQTAPEGFWGLAHPILSVLALAINGWAYVIEYRTVAANGRVQERIMDEVERRRNGGVVG